MNPPVACVGAVMNVTVHVGFHLATRRQNFPKFIGIDESSRKVDGVASQSRIMVGDDDGRFPGVSIQCLG